MLNSLGLAQNARKGYNRARNLSGVGFRQHSYVAVLTLGFSFDNPALMSGNVGGG